MREAREVCRAWHELLGWGDGMAVPLLKAKSPTQTMHSSALLDVVKKTVEDMETRLQNQMTAMLSEIKEQFAFFSQQLVQSRYHVPLSSDSAPFMSFCSFS